MYTYMHIYTGGKFVYIYICIYTPVYTRVLNMYTYKHIYIAVGGGLDRSCSGRPRIVSNVCVCACVCGVWCVVCGVWCVVCGVWCVCVCMRAVGAVERKKSSGSKNIMV